MFGDYTLTTASRHPSSLPCRDMPSPQLESLHDISRPFPRHLSISQLSQRFSEQRLQHDAASHIRSEPSTPTTSNQASSSYVGSPVPCTNSRRLQRQQGVRMLCDPAHLRNIQAMVDQMVRSESQCNVSPPRTIIMAGSGLPDPKDDEGYGSYEEKSISNRQRSGSPSLSSSSSESLSLPGAQYKRSSDMSISKTSVSKTVRVRKSRSRRTTQSTSACGL